MTATVPRVARFKYLARSIVQKSDGSPSAFLGLENVQPGVGRLVANGESIKSAEDSLVARPGDVLFGKLRPYLAKSYLVRSEVTCTGEFLVLRPTSETRPGFIFYVTLSRQWLAWAQATSFGSKMPRTSWDLMAELVIAVPALEAQDLIVDFLDRETAKIDALIGKQEQLIATLREDRIATITHAVTKGLDPDSEMKESGVKWVGYIPREWAVIPLLRCISSLVDYRGATPTKTDDGVRLVTARNVRPGFIDYETSREFVSLDEYHQVMRRGLPEIDDLLFTMEAPLGNVALVDRTDIALAQRVIKFRADPAKSNARYLLYSVLGGWFQAQIQSRATGSTALGLKASKLPELKIALPSLDEQQLIVNYLDSQCSRIDRLIDKATEVIMTLGEHRSALITAAVTGKIDVREAA